MILALLVAAAASTVAVPLGDTSLRGTAGKVAISHAAAACGTKVIFTDLPQGVHLPVKSTFGFNVAPQATNAQVKCLFEKVPSTRVGFITEPSVERPAQVKKN